MTQALPRYASPALALEAILAHVTPVGTGSVALGEAAGRALAEPVIADRDSPACDVSAMDGYAVRVADLAKGVLPLAGQVRIGREPPPLPPGTALHIVTGAAIPPGADAVIRMEDVEVRDRSIRLLIPTIRPGCDIRRQGENLPKGEQVLPEGALINSAIAGTLATFGYSRPTVRLRVRIGILTTGDEVLSADSRPRPWQIRNGNVASLYALFSTAPWCSVSEPRHAPDDPEQMTREFASLLGACDLVLITGGVSMGDRDYVPEVVQRCGCETLFHKLPIRPGKPILAARGPHGQIVLGLPGNPVSVLTTAVRFAGPVCRRFAGIRDSAGPPRVAVTDADTTAIKLWWSRPVRRLAGGAVELLPSRGSGDIVAAARSDGFIELPPEASGSGPWPFYPWEV